MRRKKGQEFGLLQGIFLRLGRQPRPVSILRCLLEASVQPLALRAPASLGSSLQDSTGLSLGGAKPPQTNTAASCPYPTFHAQVVKKKLRKQNSSRQSRHPVTPSPGSSTKCYLVLHFLLAHLGMHPEPRLKGYL